MSYAPSASRPSISRPSPTTNRVSAADPLTNVNHSRLRAISTTSGSISKKSNRCPSRPYAASDPAPKPTNPTRPSRSPNVANTDPAGPRRL
jgi:hypothetical protein